MITATASRAQQLSLFVPLPNNQLSAATSQQTARLQAVQQNPAAASVSLVQVNLGALQANPVMLALPEGNVAATWRETITRGPTDYTWIGNMPNGGQAVLVVQNGEITGQIQSGLNTYEITPMGGGLHAIVQIDQSRFPPDELGEPPVSPQTGDLPGGANENANVAAAATPTQVDVLIAYTTNAKNAYAGNMASLAQLAVDAANVAYSNSNAGVVLRLVGTIEVTYAEITARIALDAVTLGAGVMAPIHVKRDQVGADVVSLFVNEPSSCGWGWINSNAARAYSSVHYSCAVSNFSFAHEVGHNFGARHDTYVDRLNTPFPWGHGYVDPSFAWRTIMAYDTECRRVGGVRCPRVQYFSNPDVSYLGAVTGTAATNNVARVHRDRVATVAAFRAAVPRPNTHDYNGDGFSDIAWRDGSGNTALWLMNAASISSSGGIGNPASTWSMVGQRDFNGDGKTDLLWRDATGNTAVWFLSGLQIASTASIGNVPAPWSVAGSGDFNGDGFGDILWTDGAGNFAIWLMNGGTVITSGGIGTVPTAWSIAGVGDFDGDAKSDMLWRDSAGNTAIWFMNGIQMTSSSSLGNIAVTWSVVGTGDFNGDGKSDIVWRDSSGNTAVWLMNGAAIMSTGGLGNVPAAWSVALTGDYNGDGMSDILWRDTSGNTAIWFMNGTALSSTGNLGNIPSVWTMQTMNAQ